MQKFIPTEQQAAVIAKFPEYMESDEVLFRVKGYAGTGKSSLISHALQPYISKNKIVVTAFTHKAVKVIGAMTPFADAISLYSLLGKRGGRDEEKVYFYNSGRDNLDGYSIVILDESSMVKSLDSKLLYSKCVEKGIKLIVMGDPCQLPPVMHKGDSESFDIETPYSFELTQIVRQSTESQIPILASEIRDIIGRINIGEKIPIKTPLILKNRGKEIIIYSNEEEWKNKSIEEFNNPIYTVNPESVKMVAYRNRVVDDFNEKIRMARQNTLELQVGESLIVTSSNVWPLNNCDDVIVNQILDKGIYNQSHEGVEINFNWYDIQVKRITDGITCRMKIVDPTQRVQFEQQMQDWVQNIKLISNVKERKKHFKDFYYPFLEDWNTPRFNYCITSHKSQGSTYNKVFVNLRDIRNGRGGHKMLWQCLYVALTRAKHEIHILE